MTQINWHGCYTDGWQGEIVPGAFSHPAKVSRALIRRIYEHAFAEGWLHAGDVVVDPFGGIAGTALDAMWNGCHWVGCELEPRFVDLAQQNLDLWQRKYGAKSGFGSARILQGDSRKLSEIIASADLVCSSPPFVQCRQDTTASAGGIASARDGDVSIGLHYGQNERNGTTNGQLGAMKEGEPPAIVISSPPYAAIATGAGGLNTKPGKDGQQSGRNPGSASQTADQRYGESAGQLATMAEGRFDALVSSPPFERAIHGYNGIDKSKLAKPGGKSSQASAEGYGFTEGQLGESTGGTFWSAASEIVAQCHLILRPGGHAIWITKDFVRQGKRVPFSDQWQALCEAEGFRLVCRHRAMLVAHHGEQDGLFGEPTKVSTSRKSFFRRLAEAKGSPAIDWEDALCLVKTAA